MKLVQVSKSPEEVWINIGTGSVSQVCHTWDSVSSRDVPTIVLNSGQALQVSGSTLAEAVQMLKSQEQDYEKDGK